MALLAFAPLACAVLPAPPPNPATPGGGATYLTFATQLSPHRATFAERPDRPAGGASLNGETHGVANCARIPRGCLLPIPQSLSLRTPLPGRLDGGLHSTWLSGGGGLRFWFNEPGRSAPALALSTEASFGYFTPSRDIRLTGELHGQVRGAEWWVGLGANIGAHRHMLDEPTASPGGWPTDLGGYGLLRSEVRLEGVLGVTNVIPRWSVMFLSIAPYRVVLAGQPFRLRCSDCFVDLTSFSQSFGATITLGFGFMRRPNHPVD